MEKFIENIITKIENKNSDISVFYDEDQNYLEFDINTDNTGDFVFLIECGECTEDFIENLNDYYDDYDVDYETSIWIGVDGHGKCGAPYHIKDILQQMNNREDILKELVDYLTIN